MTVKGAEARNIDMYGNGEVFDYPMEHHYMVVASNAEGLGACTYAGRPRTLKEAVEHRDEIIATEPEEAARYAVWEIVQLDYIVRHRVVDTKVIDR